MTELEKILKVSVQRALPVGEVVHADYLNYLCVQNGGQLPNPRTSTEGTLYRLRHCATALTVTFPKFNGCLGIEPVPDSQSTGGQYWEIVSAEWARS